MFHCMFFVFNLMWISRNLGIYMTRDDILGFSSLRFATGKGAVSPAGFPMSLRVVQDCYEDVKRLYWMII